MGTNKLQIATKRPKMISDLGLLTNIVPGQPGLGIRKCLLRLSTAFLVVANDQVELIMTRVLLLLGNTLLDLSSYPSQAQVPAFVLFVIELSS